LSTNWDPFWDLFDVGRSVRVKLSEEETGEHQSEMIIDLPMPSAEINHVQAHQIDDWLGDDEFEACVVFTNTGLAQGEFDVKLYSADGTFID
ncbi:MAG TPA: hypothetical protein PLZ51_25865, partial [Aggregatilineales bacterium]|nr:hypothetical protein [Aggregatilineales bacterium]